jgi:type IV pilus assembly protein PilC
VLARYIAFQRLALSFRKKLLSSLVYPALLMVLVTLMLVFLITYVVPQFAKLYDQLGSQLPPLTTFMLQLGIFAQTYFPFIAAGFLALIVLIWRWRQTQAGGQAMDRARLRLPLLGEIWLKYQISIFSRMMATLLAGGLPLVPALETAGGSMQSKLISSAIAAAAQRVREGRALAVSLEETGVFPELAVEMVEVGESTGALPQMLTSAAEFYEEDVETALTAAMSLIEPIILIIMGVIVAFVLLSLYLPIFTLGTGGMTNRGGI